MFSVSSGGEQGSHRDEARNQLQTSDREIVVLRVQNSIDTKQADQDEDVVDDDDVQSQGIATMVFEPPSAKLS